MVNEQQQQYHQRAIDEIRASIGRYPDSLALMYSGGKDSSAVLLSVSSAFPEAALHLLVCNNGHIYPNELKSGITAKIRKMKDKGIIKSQVSILYFDFRELLMGLAMRSLSNDMKKYNNCYVCCACKLCMHLICSCYCQEKGIGLLLDGYRAGQRYYPEQVPEFCELVSEVVDKRCGVKMCSPLYNTLSSRDSISLLLQEFGLNPDLFDREKGGQAVCSLGGACRSPRSTNGKLDMSWYDIFVSELMQYTREKIDIITSDEVVVQNREGGRMEKPSFPKQIETITQSYECLL